MCWCRGIGTAWGFFIVLRTTAVQYAWLTRRNGRKCLKENVRKTGVVHMCDSWYTPTPKLKKRSSWLHKAGLIFLPPKNQYRIDFLFPNKSGCVLKALYRQKQPRDVDKNEKLQWGVSQKFSFAWHYIKLLTTPEVVTPARLWFGWTKPKLVLFYVFFL